MLTALRVAAPLAWTAVIFWLSGEGWSGSRTGPMMMPFLTALFPWIAPEQIQATHWLVRKAAHTTEYAVLARLWSWALLPLVTRARLTAFALSVLVAVLDELHQATTTTRTGSPIDVILDAAGAAAGLAILFGGWNALDCLISVLLWIAALGGTAAIALDWMTAAPTGWLWLSVPVAWVALALWRRPRTSRARRQSG